MFAPGILFFFGLVIVQSQPHFAWLHDVRRFPWELWTIALAGTIASVGGTLDWRFHRSGLTSVGKHEHRSHVAALALGGGSLFVLMCIASIVRIPALVLLPIIVSAIATAAMICYDEFVFHRHRCGTFETVTHRLPVFGNAIAWLAWMHWCFVRDAAYG